MLEDLTVKFAKQTAPKIFGKVGTVRVKIISIQEGENEWGDKGADQVEESGEIPAIIQSSGGAAGYIQGATWINYKILLPLYWEDQAVPMDVKFKIKKLAGQDPAIHPEEIYSIRDFDRKDNVYYEVRATLPR